MKRLGSLLLMFAFVVFGAGLAMAEDTSTQTGTATGTPAKAAKVHHKKSATPKKKHHKNAKGEETAKPETKTN